MTGPIHTYGQSCLLSDEEPDPTSFQTLLDPPEIRSQFFYVSSLPIDDPLAALPPPASQGAASERIPPKPFSARDQIALEDAWRDLREARKTKIAGQHEFRPPTSKGTSGIAVPGHESRSNFQSRPKTNSREDPGLIGSRGSTFSNTPSFPDDVPSRSHKSQLAFATGSENRAHGSRKADRVGSSLDDGIKHDTPAGIAIDRTRARSSSINESSAAKRRSSSTLDPDNDVAGNEEIGSVRANRSRDASISGSPFIRVPPSQSHTPLGRSYESNSSRDGGQERQAEVRVNAAPRSAPKPSGLRTSVSLDQLTQDSRGERTEEPNTQLKIPVGVSRLHLVELPNLKV
jgi:hypothetical protein